MDLGGSDQGSQGVGISRDRRGLPFVQPVIVLALGRGLGWFYSRFEFDLRHRHSPASSGDYRWHLPGDRPQPYAVYVDGTDAVWVNGWGANAILSFDPETEGFESFPLHPRLLGKRRADRIPAAFFNSLGRFRTERYERQGLRPGRGKDQLRQDFCGSRGFLARTRTRA
jgi:hypothetical protein